MFGKNKLSGSDRTTKELQSSGVYSIGAAPHPFVVGDSTVEAVKTKKIYGLWAGAWYTAVLSILLFWIPPFGQMIAGYVGGRKAGNPRLGIIATLIPMMFVFLLFMLKLAGHFVTEIDWFLGLPGSGADYMAAHIPVFGPVIGFMADYMASMVSAFWAGDFFIYPYVLTVIFGYVGGIMSLQHQRELEAEGKEHPFIPIGLMPVSQTAPQEFKEGEATPIPQVTPPETPTPQEPAQTPVQGPEVVMGQVPKDWKMKKDKKKGKWKK